MSTFKIRNKNIANFQLLMLNDDQVTFSFQYVRVQLISDQNKQTIGTLILIQYRLKQIHNILINKSKKSESKIEQKKKQMEGAKSFLIKIDSFGKTINIYYKNQQVYRTLFGGIMTLIIWAFCGVLCYFFGNQLINKQNPQVITTERYVQQAKRINVTRDNLIFMFGLDNINSTFFLDPTLFQFRAVQLVKQTSINNQTGEPVITLVPYNLTMKVCDMGDVGIPSAYNYFDSLDVSLLYCFSQGQDIYMEGDFDSDNFAQIYVYIDKCQNSTSSNTICQPKEIINQQLSQTYLSFYFTNLLVDPNNYEQPFQHQGMNLYTSTSSSFPKEFQLYFTNQYLQDDVGILFSEIVEQHSIIYTNYQETTFFGDDQTLVRILLRIQKQKENLMQRRYQKIQDVLPQIIGFLKLMTFGLSLIVNPIINLKMYQDLGENIFVNEQPKKLSMNHAKLLKKAKQKYEKNYNKQISQNCDENDEPQFQMSPVIYLANSSSVKNKLGNDSEHKLNRLSFKKKNSYFFSNFDDQRGLFSPKLELNKTAQADNFDDVDEEKQSQISPVISQKQLSINRNKLRLQQKLQSPQHRYNKKTSYYDSSFLGEQANRPHFSPQAKFKKDVDISNFIYSPQSPQSIDQKIQNDQENYQNTNTFIAEQQPYLKNNFKIKINEIENNKLVESQFQDINPITIQTDAIEQQKPQNRIQKKQKFSFSLKHYIMMVFCNKKMKNESAAKMKYGIKSIQKQLDIIYIISKLQEIDKLKSVILDEDQLKLFNNISKPILSGKQKQQETDSNQQNVQKPNIYESTVLINSIYQFTKEYKQYNQKKIDEKKQQSENLQALQNILEKQKFSQIDKRLIELNYENLNIDNMQVQLE
ncbi:transmembrane protein, putative (macronuclear) [Tetrahymena thermophila SB210]|uniref:Transmembrane protein, putative n=1 Tax=Tetrahymena thermophila (strain SB210) TaxID=312017 RepID=Q22WA3_TETTS|nr:transmembrane protein, putative [Tetrahymena thermophila SB210]EAR89514.2 transmembrane protein, putative [Tetrahymena thermophila SB210]|eukprot:XP_001009759.2 transmembrane protein, putative [Tetrahymena thermophila SB210]